MAAHWGCVTVSTTRVRMPHSLCEIPLAAFKIHEELCSCAANGAHSGSDVSSFIRYCAASPRQLLNKAVKLLKLSEKGKSIQTLQLSQKWWRISDYVTLIE